MAVKYCWIDLYPLYPKRAMKSLTDCSEIGHGCWSISCINCRYVLTADEYADVVLCANIAPYEEDRAYNRELISQHGHYIEVYMNTPLAVCEDRDVKGLYALARNGVIKEFTGISDPFNVPSLSELELTHNTSITNSVQKIMNYLISKELF